MCDKSSGRIIVNNNDVMKVCYNNFWRSDEGVRLQCEFDIAAGVSAEDIKTIVFSKFLPRDAL